MSPDLHCVDRSSLGQLHTARLSPPPLSTSHPPPLHAISSDVTPLPSLQHPCAFSICQASRHPLTPNSHFISPMHPSWMPSRINGSLLCALWTDNRHCADHMGWQWCLYVVVSPTKDSEPLEIRDPVALPFCPCQEPRWIIQMISQKQNFIKAPGTWLQHLIQAASHGWR